MYFILAIDEGLISNSLRARVRQFVALGICMGGSSWTGQTDVSAPKAEDSVAVHSFLRKRIPLRIHCAARKKREAKVSLWSNFWTDGNIWFLHFFFTIITVIMIIFAVISIHNDPKKILWIGNEKKKRSSSSLGVSAPTRFL